MERSVNIEKILEIRKLKTTFHSHKKTIPSVRGVSLHVEKGEILAIVGESGSGKSVTMKSVMGLLPENAKVEAESLAFEGKDVLHLSENEKRNMRGRDISMIFQDPMTALNPLKKIGAHLTEIIMRHQNVRKKEAVYIAVSMLDKVGIPSPESRMKQYPHEFSGGMRQRVLIAMALCSKPKLLIADEPTTALDVTIQAQILELLKRLNREEGMSMILITHDLGVVASLADRIAVMYGGLIMEEGTTDEVFYHPRHPYTRALLQAIPRCESGCKGRLEPIKGTAPSLLELQRGCPFAPRCRYSGVKCRRETPQSAWYTRTQYARCHYNEEELEKLEMQPKEENLEKYEKLEKCEKYEKLEKYEKGEM